MENNELSKETLLEDFVINKIIQSDKENLKKFITGETNSISAVVTFSKDNLISFIKDKFNDNKEECKLKVIEYGIKKGFIVRCDNVQLCIKSKNYTKSSFGQLLNLINIDKINEFASIRLEINNLLYKSEEQNIASSSSMYIDNIINFIEKNINDFQDEIIKAYKEADTEVQKLYGKFFTDLFFVTAFKKGVLLDKFHFSVKKYLKGNEKYRKQCFTFYMNAVKENEIADKILDKVRSCFSVIDYENVRDDEEAAEKERIVYILTKLECSFKQMNDDCYIGYNGDTSSLKISKDKLKNVLIQINPDLKKDKNKLEEVFKNIMGNCYETNPKGEMDNT